MANFKRKRRSHSTVCGLCKPHKRWGDRGNKKLVPHIHTKEWKNVFGSVGDNVAVQ